MITSLVLTALVILPTRIEVAEGKITAADLVGESAVTLGDVERMREVGLGKAPAAGQMRRIGGPYLRRLLRAAKVSGVRVPAQIELIGRADIITAEQQLKAIRAYLKKRLGAKGQIEQVRAFQNVTEFKVPPGSKIASVLPVSANPFTARSSFKMEIRRRGRLVMRRYPQVTIQGKAQVRVARQTISARRPITEADFTVETLELSRIPARSLGRFQVAGMLAGRRIAVGRVVSRNDLKSPPVVHRGQRVRIELRQASVSVSTTGEALADAVLASPFLPPRFFPMVHLLLPRVQT